MKKSYIPPKSNLYAIKFDENIASSIGGGDSGDTLEGLLIIMFTSSVSPCRDYYTGSAASPNTVGPDGTFMEYFVDMQAQGAPIGCMLPK